MTLICGKISADFLRDCTSKPIGGVKSRLYLINQEDILTITYDVDNPLIVRAMALNTGAAAFSWDVFKRNHKPKATQKDTTYSVNYQHELATYIPDWDSDIKFQAEQLGNGYYVVIVENLANTTDAAFEIYGLKSGMRAQDGSLRDLGANEGLFTLNMSNDADQFEDHLPASFGVLTSGGSPVYSYTDTKAAVIALLTPAT